MAKRKTAAAGEGGLLGAVTSDASPAAAAAPTSERTDSKGRKWTNVKCKTCGRFYWAAYKASQGPPTARCCGMLYCDAVQHWSVEQWTLRARSVQRRPPSPTAWTLLRHSTNGQCTWCTSATAVYVMPMGTQMPNLVIDPSHDRVVACVSCGLVVRTFRSEPTPSDMVDAEALRRHPLTDAA